MAHHHPSPVDPLIWTATPANLLHLPLRWPEAKDMTTSGVDCFVMVLRFMTDRNGVLRKELTKINPIANPLAAYGLSMYADQDEPRARQALAKFAGPGIPFKQISEHAITSDTLWCLEPFKAVESIIKSGFGHDVRVKREAEETQLFSFEYPGGKMQEWINQKFRGHIMYDALYKQTDEFHRITDPGGNEEDDALCHRPGARAVPTVIKIHYKSPNWCLEPVPKWEDLAHFTIFPEDIFQSEQARSQARKLARTYTISAVVRLRADQNEPDLVRVYGADGMNHNPPEKAAAYTAEPGGTAGDWSIFDITPHEYMLFYVEKGNGFFETRDGWGFEEISNLTKRTKVIKPWYAAEERPYSSRKRQKA